MNSEDYKAGCYYRNKQGVILIGLNMLADSYCKGLVIEENQLKYFQEFSIASIEEITFQEAFTDEIESIVRQYKDAHDATLAINAKAMKYMDEAHEANSKLKEKADLFLEARNELILENSALLGNNNELREEIENLKIERDQLVIDYDELERKQFDSELVQVSIKIEESIDDKNWCDLVSDTSISIENDTKYEVYKVWASHPRFIRVKLANKGISYEAMCNNLSNNNEYALKAENDSLKKALDKLSDLTVKFYLKSEGITL